MRRLLIPLLASTLLLAACKSASSAGKDSLLPCRRQKPRAV